MSKNIRPLARLFCLSLFVMAALAQQDAFMRHMEAALEAMKVVGASS